MNPMTFNPFESLLKGLTGDQQRKRAALDSPDIEPKAGIGAFSIRRAYIHVAHGTPGSAGDEDDESKSRAVIRPDTIETCYGYWVANCFVKDVDDKLEGAAADKGEFLAGLVSGRRHRNQDRSRTLAYSVPGHRLISLQRQPRMTP